MGKTRERPERYEQHVLELPGVTRPPRRLYTPDDVVRLHEALEPFIDLPDLRRCVAEQRDVYEALRVDNPPRELEAMMRVLAAVLEPRDRMQVRSPADVAGMLILTLGQKDQEELWTVMLDTKNRMLGTHCVYKGSLNASMVRVGEVYKEALKRNAAIIIAHQHPSGDVTPSPEDVMVIRVVRYFIMTCLYTITCHKVNQENSLD
jgi:proteasome lid subunit RPN8/RPN11